MYDYCVIKINGFGMNRSHAIVLKHYTPQKQVICLLDRSLGRIKAAVQHERLSVGTIVTYHYDDIGHYPMIKSIEIEYLPFVAVPFDMLFLHHIIEVCYHIIPEGAQVGRLYHLMVVVFSQRIFTHIQKKKILCAVYALLGLYAHENNVYARYMYQLEQSSLNEIMDNNIDVNIEKNISRWLYQCISLHVDVRLLRTVHFLYEI